MVVVGIHASANGTVAVNVNVTGAGIETEEGTGTGTGTETGTETGTGTGIEVVIVIVIVIVETETETETVGIIVTSLVRAPVPVGTEVVTATRTQGEDLLDMVTTHAPDGAVAVVAGIGIGIGIEIEIETPDRKGTTTTTTIHTKAILHQWMAPTQAQEHPRARHRGEWDSREDHRLHINNNNNNPSPTEIPQIQTLGVHCHLECPRVCRPCPHYNSSNPHNSTTLCMHRTDLRPLNHPQTPTMVPHHTHNRQMQTTATTKVPRCMT